MTPNSSLARVLLASALLASSAAAQGGYRTYEDRRHGFKMKVPGFLTQQPLEPLEEQILVKWSGKAKGKWQGRTRELELILLVARIEKGKGPTTDAGGERKKSARLKSLQEQKRERLNGGTTIEEFLERRGWVHDKRWRQDLEGPIKGRLPRPFQVYEVSSSSDQTLAIRVFYVEDDREIFGVFALGRGAVEAFHPWILRAVKSLQIIAADAGSRGLGTISYAGSGLRGIEHREKVRRRLVKGWEAFDTENFILVTNVRNKKLIKDMLIELEVMRREYEKHFPPLEPITAISTVRLCAGYDEYLGYGAPEGTGGYWNPIDEELVLFDPGRRIPKAKEWLKKVDPKAVMYHEAMHQYLHYANGRVPPASWFNEGYGEYFGGAVVDRRKREIRKIAKNKFRMAWVKSMQRQRAWPDLRFVLSITQPTFYGRGVLQNYAMAWSICYFLEQERAKKKGERNEKWAAIPELYLENLRAAMKEKLKDMPQGAPKDWIMGFKTEIQQAAFEKTFGAWTDDDWAELEKAWHAAMRKW